MKFWSWCLECVVLGLLFWITIMAVFSLPGEIAVYIVLFLAGCKTLDILSYFTKFIFNRMGNDGHEAMEDRKQG